MKIGVLETGLIREELADRFEPYPIMFGSLLDQSGHQIEIDSTSVVRGEMPNSVHDCDGWLITGSRHGVYDNLEWMPPLQDFIRKLADAQVPLVGVCFGHQIIAQALGGQVVKSDKGWGVGLHKYFIDQSQDWMQEHPEQVGIYAFHQDQVIELPDSAQVFLSSEFCPYAGLTYGDSIMSVQGHPEFEESYMTALLDQFGGNVVPSDVAAEARSSMAGGQYADTAMLASWIGEFLRFGEKLSKTG